MQISFIKPINYEYGNSKKFKAQIGRRENMRYDEIEDCYYCVDGRVLVLRREKSELKVGYTKTTAYYRCDDCGGCPHKDKCFKSKKYPNKPLEVHRSLSFRHKPVCGLLIFTGKRECLNFCFETRPFLFTTSSPLVFAELYYLR